MSNNIEPEAEVVSSETPRNHVSTAYTSVRNSILEGHLKPGSWISQLQLADDLKISRTPLREALRQLQSEGLVQLDFNRRIQVAPLSVSDLEAVYALRVVNEPLAVLFSVPLLTDDQLSAIHTHLVSMNAAADAKEEDSAIRHHRLFHFGLFQHAADRLRTSVESWWDHSVRYVKLYQDAPSYRLGLIGMGAEGHQRMYEAAVARDGETASQLAVEHLGRTALTVIGNIDATYEPRSFRRSLLYASNAAERPSIG